MTNNIINYTFSISEEIARWTTEVYIRNEQTDGWWVAFTNPVAGPWKKINSLDDKMNLIEIHRFERDKERPDLILVNDTMQIIVIVEAKDYVEKIANNTQMLKSVRVIDEIVTILQSCTHNSWTKRRGYRFIPSFLWFCNNEELLRLEDSKVRESYGNIRGPGHNPSDIVNIVITKDTTRTLRNNFIYSSGVKSSLVF